MLPGHNPVWWVKNSIIIVNKKYSGNRLSISFSAKFAKDYLYPQLE